MLKFFSILYRVFIFRAIVILIMFVLNLGFTWKVFNNYIYFFHFQSGRPGTITIRVMEIFLKTLVKKTTNSTKSKSQNLHIQKTVFEFFVEYESRNMKPTALNNLFRVILFLKLPCKYPNPDLDSFVRANLKIMRQILRVKTMALLTHPWVRKLPFFSNSPLR